MKEQFLRKNESFIQETAKSIIDFAHIPKPQEGNERIATLHDILGRTLAAIVVAESKNIPILACYKSSDPSIRVALNTITEEAGMIVDHIILQYHLSTDVQKNNSEHIEAALITGLKTLRIHLEKKLDEADIVQMTNDEIPRKEHDADQILTTITIASIFLVLYGVVSSFVSYFLKDNDQKNVPPTTNPLKQLADQERDKEKTPKPSTPPR